MWGTFFGMLPLCYLQSYLAMELVLTFPWLLWPFIILCGVYALLVAYALLRVSALPKRGASDQD
jgi:hypothetical protein